VRAVQLANTSTTNTNTTNTTKSSSWWGSSSSTGLVSTITSGHAPQITPTKYYFKKAMGARTAAACVGPAAPSLSSLLARRQDPPHRNVIFTVGSDPPFASFIVEESQTGGSILSLVAGIATSSASELFGRAKSFLPGSSINTTSNTAATAAAAGGGNNTNSHSSSRPATPTGLGGTTLINSNSLTPLSTTTDTSNLKKREKIPGITIHQETAVWDDEKRKVNHLALSPCCRWAACCDSLGRVLLIDVASCVVLKMLKGYREAQAAWFIPSSSSSSELLNTNKEATAAAAATATTSALLVVYAPRRGVVELWKPHCGVRVGSISNTSVPQKGILLEQPAVPLSLVPTSHHHQHHCHSACSQSWRSFQSNRCWMLDLESLELVDLTNTLNQLLVNSS
jgi:hypothetical protein